MGAQLYFVNCLKTVLACIKALAHSHINDVSLMYTDIELYNKLARMTSGVNFRILPCLSTLEKLRLTKLHKGIMSGTVIDLSKSQILQILQILLHTITNTKITNWIRTMLPPTVV